MRVDNRPERAARQPSERGATRGEGFRDALQAAEPAAPARAPAAARRGRTPLTPARAAAHLANAWERVTGQRPSPKTLSLLWAQWALETGRGRSMQDHNFGGLKGAGPEGDSQVYWTTEGHGTDAVRIRSSFRSYESADAGAVDYVSTLKNDYPEAFESAAAGDADGFTRGLDRRRYFTADPKEYSRSIDSLSREYLSRGPSGSLEVADPGPAVEMLLYTLQRAAEKRRA